MERYISQAIDMKRFQIIVESVVIYNDALKTFDNIEFKYKGLIFYEFFILFNRSNFY